MIPILKSTIKKIRFILNGLFRNELYFVNYGGKCTCCNSVTTFYSESNWLRDHLICKNCNSIPRERALMEVIEANYPNWRNMNIHETSPVKRGASIKLATAQQYSESQFFPNQTPGSYFNGIRCENIEQLTFETNSIDIFISQDVMEHIYHPDKAFKEIARVLKPGGAHIFTTPLVNKFKPSQKWATLNADGSPNFLFEPEYHGNPVDDSGSPVTMHWGYDIIDYIKEHSNLESSIEYIYDIKKGIAAEFNEVIVSKKI